VNRHWCRFRGKTAPFKLGLIIRFPIFSKEERAGATESEVTPLSNRQPYWGEKQGSKHQTRIQTEKAARKKEDLSGIAARECPVRGTCGLKTRRRKEAMPMRPKQGDPLPDPKLQEEPAENIKDKVANPITKKIYGRGKFFSPKKRNTRKSRIIKQTKRLSPKRPRQAGEKPPLLSGKEKPPPKRKKKP